MVLLQQMETSQMSGGNEPPAASSGESASSLPNHDQATGFSELYRRNFSDVLRFVTRRLIPPDEIRAEDLTHEAFLIAWHQFDKVPRQPGAARAWLFTAARNCLLNENRSRHRASALQIRINDAAAAFVPANDDAVANRLDLATAWQTLTATDQEVIALTVWDKLTSVEAGKVLGISSAAYRLRLHRARAALKKALGTP